MIAIDTNIMVYAHCENSPFHKKALLKLKALSEGSELWAVPVFFFVEFVRVVTHPKLLNPPTSIEAALTVINQIKTSPSLRVLYPQARFCELFEDLCRNARVRGNLAFDAQIVAVMIENGVDTLLSEDRDFCRFSLIRVNSLDGRV